MTDKNVNSGILDWFNRKKVYFDSMPNKVFELNFSRKSFIRIWIGLLRKNLRKKNKKIVDKKYTKKHKF
ncbi:hypothetical protein [Pectinatus sottacetonis]|uniref:hypothetical protein n=1 Tax=Pectinatus sottacetonis TaxID=1002795 RepID=UPI0018C68A04|nr:hypothetical protein [Pectinatus sottacetonis]